MKKMEDWNDLRLDEILPLMVQERHQKIKDAGHWVSADTTMRMLNRLIEWAQLYYLDELGRPLEIHNPVKRLAAIKAFAKTGTRINKYIPEDRLANWWKQVNDLKAVHVRDLLKFLLFTGCRINEATNLKWEDTDLENGVFVVEKTKNGKLLRLPLSTYMIDLLKTRKKVFPAYAYVFPGRCGPIKNARVKELADVPYKNHDLRRTMINIASHPDCKADELALKALLNHTTTGVTYVHYLTVHIERLRPVVQAVSDRILSLVEPEQSKVSNPVTPSVIAPAVNLVLPPSPPPEAQAVSVSAWEVSALTQREEAI